LAVDVVVVVVVVVEHADVGQEALVV